MDKCLAAIHLCRIRVTRLNSDGSPASGDNNVYVSDKPIQLGVTPVILAGENKDLVGGCDCLLATYRGTDKLKRFDFELDLGLLEPALLEMLLGNTAILDGTSTDVIGNWWTNQAFDCSSIVQPFLCFEGWQTGWEDSGPSATWPYIHWIWPNTSWQIAAHTLGNDFAQPKVTGFSRGNDQWGLGIFDDLPEAAEPLGGWFFSDEIPTAECGYQTHAIT